MRKKKSKIIAMLLFGLGFITTEAQNTIPASGGNASGSGAMGAHPGNMKFHFWEIELLWLLFWF